VTPSKLPLQAAIVSRLTSAVSVDVGTDPGVPGVEVGDDDESQVSENTSAVHTDVSHTIRARAFSETKAKEIGQDAASALTDRSDLPQPSGKFAVLDATLTGADMQQLERTQGPSIFTDIIIVTFRVTRA
jgi:hypothetical protein